VFFTVGASGTNTNTIAPFSSRGPIRLDGSNRLKPEITAPGVQVMSSTLNKRYSALSGTSMASPAVNGAIALIWEAIPKLNRKLTETQDLIQKTATKMDVSNTCNSNGTPKNVYGYLIINVIDAF
jgi:subtilisin family serine protease